MDVPPSQGSALRLFPQISPWTAEAFGFFSHACSNGLCHLGGMRRRLVCVVPSYPSKWHREVVAAYTRRVPLGGTGRLLCTCRTSPSRLSFPVATREAVSSALCLAWHKLAASITQISRPGYETGKCASYTREWRGHTTTIEVSPALHSARRARTGFDGLCMHELETDRWKYATDESFGTNVLQFRR